MMYGCEDKRDATCLGIDCLHNVLDDIDLHRINGEIHLDEVADMMLQAKMLAHNLGVQAATNAFLKLEKAHIDNKEWKEVFLKTVIENEAKQERGLAGDFVYGVYGLYFTSYIMNNHHDAVPTHDEIEAYRKMMKQKGSK